MKSRTSGQALDSVRRRGAANNNSRSPLRASEIRFRRLFETAQDGVLILDGQTHRILEANPFITALLRRPKKELIGKRLPDVGILKDKEERRKKFEQLLKGGCVRFEHSWPGSDPGRFEELEFVCNAYDEGRRRLIQCNIRDIAQRKEGERRLREALQELADAKRELEARVQERTADLEQRNGELEAFSYSLSHDLRAPIRAIVSFTQIALEEYGRKAGRPATELLEKAIVAAQRLDHLILDVLAFSKATRQPVRRQNVDVERLLRDILQERPEWAPPSVQIKIQAPLLPIDGDQASLTQCLTNLLGNAVKFVRPGVLPRVLVYTEQVGPRVRLHVQDNGLGIPLSAQGRVFDLFHRAHNGYEGHGIGLAIVRRAAERMGGRVGLHSESGKGSTFWVELPGIEPQATQDLKSRKED
jgi:PAS domain S-box-containing protein